MSIQSLLNPKAELFRWGPIPMKFFYVSTFFEAVRLSFPQNYDNAHWPPTIFLRHQGRMVWVNEYPALKAAGRDVFKKFVLPEKMRHEIKKEWRAEVDRITEIERKIEKSSLSEMSEKQLLVLWKEFHQAYLDFWTPTIAPELGNYGSADLLEEELANFIPDEKERAMAMEALTAPEERSFYQKEELDLIKTKDLADHQQQYYWLKNSYNGTKILPISFFAARKKELKPDLAKRIEEQPQRTRKRKAEIVKRYKIPSHVMDIATALREAVEWQDERKEHIFIILHFEDVLLSEISQRYGYSFDELHSAWYIEISEILQGKDLHERLKKRESDFGIEVYTEVKELTSAEAAEWWDTFAQEKVESNQQLKGVIASRGEKPVVRGKVRIVLDPHKAEAFQDGEILIAPMTSPEYVFAMKKSAAVVTDAGGLTSHAAIVSRELNIPCIVGTKVATQVLKDGDLVEVDAAKGTVIKI